MQSPRPFPEVVEIVVEIPRGSRNKYEFDEEAEVFRLDRVLSSAVFYNFDYGFIDGTRAGDGDHTDALLIIDEPTFTGCHVWARPIGGLEMRDEKGFDFKVLCVALGDAHQQHIERLEQVRPHRLVEIEHFFQTYKALEDKTVEVVGWREHERALEVLRADRETGTRGRETQPLTERRPVRGGAPATRRRSTTSPRSWSGSVRSAPSRPPTNATSAGCAWTACISRCASSVRRPKPSVPTVAEAVRRVASTQDRLRVRLAGGGSFPESRAGHGRCGWP